MGMQQRSCFSLFTSRNTSSFPLTVNLLIALMVFSAYLDGGTLNSHNLRRSIALGILAFGGHFLHWANSALKETSLK